MMSNLTKGGAQHVLALKSPTRKKWENSRTLILMSLPAIVFFLVFAYLPMPGAYIAFTNFNYRDGIFGSPFVGMNNFKFLWNSGKLLLLTRNTVLYNLAFILVGNVLQIFIAVLLNEIQKNGLKK